MSELPQYHLTDGVATLTLDRPDRRNAMDGALAEAVLRALERVRGRRRPVRREP